jgi:hypothetical protein
MFGEKAPYRLQAHAVLQAKRRQQSCHKQPEV